MKSSKTFDAFLALVRIGIGHENNSLPKDVDWTALKVLADAQGLSAVVLDGLNAVQSEGGMVNGSMPKKMRLEWIGEVLQNFEGRFGLYEKAIGSLAGFYNQHGYKMMVLKGYGLSMNWPNPKHRPCGDIDIWLFGQQSEADDAIDSWFKAHGAKREIDSSHHHHTVFEWQEFTVENHYDFLNVHHHKSNVEIEQILKELGGIRHTGITDISKSDGTKITYVMVNDTSTGSATKVYLPSANLHALFMLRHAMSHFASTGFNLRQLLDWGFFVEKHGTEIDWLWLEGQLEHFGMKKCYDIFNAICVENLGFEVKIFPLVKFDPALKERVLNDILSPEFTEKESGGFFSRAVFKYRRWKANAWKHELCFSESLWGAFWSGVWNHLLKPASI